MPGTPRSLDELLKDLRDVDPMTRIHARQHLAQRGEWAVAGLVEMLHAPEAQFRWEAAKTLAEIAHPSTALELIDVMAIDPDSDVRWVASDALSAIGPAVIKPLLQRLACKPLPDQPPQDLLYHGAHRVLHALASRCDMQPFAKLVETLSREEPELAVPLIAAELLETLGTNAI